MMRASSTHTLSPVVTILSPSPTASRRAQEILGSIFGLKEASLDDASEDDVLNAKFGGSPLMGSSTSLIWDSRVSQCPNSGALVHWLSLENNTSFFNNDNRRGGGGGFSLLGVTSTTTKPAGASTTNLIKETRDILASNFPSSSLSLRVRHFLQRPMTVDTLLKRHQGLPVLELPASAESLATATSPDDNNNKKFDGGGGGEKTRLKEIAFTIYDDAAYEDGSTVLSRLSQSSFSRPVTGLYEWPTATADCVGGMNNKNRNGIWLRPVPAAKQDLTGGKPPLVLTFHCDSIERVLQECSDSNNNNCPVDFSLSKIGFTGQGTGQLRIEATDANNNNNPLNGLDVRWCERINPTSFFTEAHESLLASSLPELQSVNVLKSTGRDEPGKDDNKIGSSDCWVEVRTMVQNPGCFVPSTMKGGGSSSRSSRTSSNNKVATAPPSYPE